jgi:hypothetical protein
MKGCHAAEAAFLSHKLLSLPHPFAAAGGMRTMGPNLHDIGESREGGRGDGGPCIRMDCSRVKNLQDEPNQRSPFVAVCCQKGPSPPSPPERREGLLRDVVVGDEDGQKDRRDGTSPLHPYSEQLRGNT